MLNKKILIPAFLAVSLFVSAPAFGATKTHKKVVVAKKTVVVKKVTLSPVTTPPVVVVPEVVVVTPTANVVTDYVFTPAVQTPVVVQTPPEAVSTPPTPVEAPTTPQVVVSPPVIVQPPAPVIVSQATVVAPPVSSAPAVCYPSVGVSCTYTPAPTTQTTSQVLAPNTIGFNTQPTNGQQTYTPVVQTGTPSNGAVTITVSGNATTDGTTVTFTDNGVVAITATQNGAQPVTQVVQVTGVTDVSNVGA
jgi:hypothetical protein